MGTIEKNPIGGQNRICCSDFSEKSDSSSGFFGKIGFIDRIFQKNPIFPRIQNQIFRWGSDPKILADDYAPITMILHQNTPGSLCSTPVKSLEVQEGGMAPKEAIYGGL